MIFFDRHSILKVIKSVLFRMAIIHDEHFQISNKISDVCYLFSVHILFELFVSSVNISIYNQENNLSLHSFLQRSIIITFKINALIVNGINSTNIWL